MADGGRRPAHANAALRVLTQGSYGTFFAANGLSLIGTWMQRVAAAWLVWEWTGSAFWVGVLAACDLLPVLLTGPFAGVAADRWDRLRQNRLAQIVSTLLALTNAVLLMADMLGLAGLLTLIAVQGTVTAVIQPARMAMVTQMVSRSDMPVAVALGSVNVNLARLIGPAIAGVMILRVDVEWIFIVNAVFTAILVVVLARIRLTPREEGPLPGNFWHQMRDGFAYVANTASIRLTMLLMLDGGILVRSVQELTPAVAAQVFSTSATGLAVMTSATAAGAVASGLSMRPTEPRRLMLGLFAYWAAAAVAAVALVHTRQMAVAVVATAVLGFTIARCVISTQTFVQLSTPDTLRGRVLALHGLITRASPALGALLIGFGADRAGLSLSVTTAATVMLTIAALLYPRGRAQARQM